MWNLKLPDQAAAQLETEIDKEERNKFFKKLKKKPRYTFIMIMLVVNTIQTNGDWKKKKNRKLFPDIGKTTPGHRDRVDNLRKSDINDNR